MLEAMHWVAWLDEEQRHLVWMRAKRHSWRDITIRFACDRTAVTGGIGRCRRQAQRCPALTRRQARG